MSIPENWQPSYDERVTRSMLDRYKGRAHLLSDKQKQELEYHAQAYNLPFYTGDFSVIDAIGQVGAGFVEGFTTLNIADYPDNEYEQIARNIGHLTGFAPGIIAGPAKLLPAKWVTARATAATAAKLKSIPMKGADIATKYAKQALKSASKGFVGRNQTVQTTKNFLMGNKARHIVEGAFHLGTASAISSWQGGVDQMIEAGMGGAVAGSVFRTIGNLTPGTSAHEKVGKAIAGSLFMGLPSTMRGDTTPEQIYEYLMGAYFGGNEVSWSRAKANKFVQKMDKWSKSKDTQKDAIKSGMDPEFHPEFAKLPEEVKPLAKEQAAKIFGAPEVNLAKNMPHLLMEELGLKGELTEQELIAEGAKPTGEYKDGQAVYRFDKKVIAEKFASYLTSGNLSGDNFFAKEADKVGIPTIQYSYGHKGRKKGGLGYQRILSAEELQDAEIQLQKAESSLRRTAPKGKTQRETEDKRNVQRTNWYKVKFADSVYVLGNFNEGKRSLKGAQGIAAQMAIQNGKKVYAFGEAEGRWFKWNQGARKFTEAGKPPKPTRRFAGITGPGKVSPKAKQAIKSLFSAHFAPTQPISESIAKQQVSKQKEARIESLRDEIDTLQELYLDKKSDILVNKKAGKDTTAAEFELSQIAEQQKDIVERHNRLANFGLAIKTVTPEIKNKEATSNEIADSANSDFEGPVDLEVGKIPLQFTSKHLEKAWSGEGTVLLKQNKKRELAQLVEQTLLETEDGRPISQGGIPKYVRPGKKENLSENWADAVQEKIRETYGDTEFNLSTEARQDMRKWMTRKNLGRIVTHLQSDGTKIRVMSNPKAPISLAGNRKNQQEPLKRIEEAHMEAGGKTPEQEPIYMVLDHVTIDGKNGRRDVTISEYRRDYSKDYNKMMKDAIKDMAKRGYYPLGGKGDADRIIWVKHHPLAAGFTANQLKTKLSETGLGKEIISSFRDFKKQYKGNVSDFRKMVLSNIYYDLQMNGMEVNQKNIKTLLTGDGFIKNSAAFNKRQQIWMNNAWSGDVEFIKKQGVKLTDIVNKETGELQENYSYIISRDLSEKITSLPKKEQKRLQKLISTKNSETSENVDGAIIVSDKVLDAINADFGHPQSGQNKSFIVSPHKTRGALLGKYMMHSAGPEMSKMMDAKGLHMIMQESAVKQRGLREIGDYNIKNGELVFDKKFVYSDLSPEHVRGDFGVFGNNHFIENQRIPKQLLQSLLPTAFKSVKTETINDMFESIVGNRWRGTEEYNNKLTDYLDRAKSGELRPKELADLEKELIDNIESIGINEIVDAMKADYVPGLSEAIYNKILKINKNEAMSEFTDKNASEMGYEEYNNTISEFNSLTDRVLQNATEWVESQRDKGINADITSVYMHKFVRDFRIKAVQNWIINSATKPKRDNSAVGFMRPYDKAMRLNLDKVKKSRLKELETNDEIFFLDNAFKDLYVKLDIPGESKIKGMKLGALWEKYNNKNTSPKAKEYIEDVFEAVTVRVPMDSMSGAQVLKFAGFTGRKGHGILMHGRAMKAEGGADLDGDKSFIFFGGRGGMESKWKEAYKTNKEEFYTGEGANRMVGDNKEAVNPLTGKNYRDELTLNLSKEQKELFESKAYQYSPVERLRISQAAVDGRKQLGPAVTSKQVMSAAYSSIVANGGKDFLQIKLPTGKKNKNGKLQYGIYRIEMKARTSEEAKDAQRGMGRAQVGLSSDPLDELGLTGSGDWFKKMWKAHFTIGDVKRMGKGGKFNVPVSKEFIDKKITPDSLSPSNLRGGIYSALVNINEAYWGRNWSEGRKFSMAEIIEKGNQIEKLSQYGRKVIEPSVLARTGEILQGLDWSDSVFGKINQATFNKAYEAHNNRLNEYEWLKGMLGRSSFAVYPGNIVKNVMNPKFKLWTGHGIDTTSSYYKDFLAAVKGTKYERRVQENLAEFFGISEAGEKYNGDNRHLIARRNLLQEMVKEAEDFVINDMTDIATIMEVSKIADEMIKGRDNGYIQLENVKEKQLNLKQTFELIHKKVESLKKRSYLMARDRRRLKSYETLIDRVDISTEPGRKLVELFNSQLAATGKKQKVKKVQDDITAELDQMQIDSEIVKFKERLTQRGIRLFDHLMLGSLNRGNLNKITQFEDKVGAWDQLSMDVLKGLKKEASRTSISRLGFSSNAVSDVAIKEHIASFANNFKETYRPLTPEQSNELISNADKYNSRIETMDPGIIEALLPSGYQGLTKGKLDKSSHKIVTEIADMMSTWSNAQKKQLPYLVRKVVYKDLNAMNKQDFVVFRNWLQDIQNGSWLQRIFQPKGPTALGKRHYMLFPKAINKELMRDDMVMMKEQGFFIDAMGDPRPGQIVKPTHYIDIVQNFIAKMNDSAVKISDEYIKKFNESMLFHSGLEDSQALWEIAVRKREASKENEKVINQKYNTDKTVRDKAVKELRTRLGEAERKYGWKDKKGAPGLESKKYTVTVDGVRKTMTGNEIQERINLELTSLFRNMHEFITGKEGALDAYEVERWEGGAKVKRYMYKQFVKDLQSHISGNTPKGWVKEGITDIPSYFGIDGLRRMAREMQLDMITDPEVKSKIRNMPAHELLTKDWGDTYFPHMFFDKVASKRLMNEAMKKILETPDSQMTKEQKMDEIRKLYYKNKSLGGDMRFQEMEDWDLVHDVLDDIATKKKVSEQKIKWFNANERSGSMKSRELHMGGYSIDPVVVESYVRSLSNTYHRQLSQMFGRQSIDNMYGQMRGKWGQEQTTAWQNFMRLYIQDAIGNPAIIPERLYEDPKMKIKGTPYGWWADNKVRDRINSIRKKLNIGDKALPEDLRGIDVENLRHWSNLEAQYQMATLLAHPKSAVANVFGGTAHTIQSAGWGNFVKARSPKFLSKINPEWKSMKDVDDFVVRQGVLPEYLVYEMGLQKEFQNTKGKGFLNDLSAKLARDPEMSEKSIGELASQHGLKDKAMNIASKFMSVPERMLRRDAFMAHYVHAWEKYGNAIKEYDHPFLIEMAKKGVKATQFLYNAPFRPAFARTSLGKVMTRFQLWGWNSVRFRNDVHRQAKIYGFRPGTEEWKRFERTMQTDLFTFALANVFAYSLFESNLPQPWGWAQDYADWIFGDEGERDKAFYGAWPKAVAPLQMVTPPGLRMVGPTFNALLSDDWSRIGQYYSYTLLPFGRVIRDVNPYAQGNLVENPMRLPEKIFGFPMMQLQRNITEWKDEKPEKLYPG